MGADLNEVDHGSIRDFSWTALPGAENAGLDRNIESDSAWGSPCVLTLDGEGVRGLSSLYILQSLMENIAYHEQRLEPHAASSTASPLFQDLRDRTSNPQQHYRPCHYFDYICGVSMGGISAIMLGIMRFTVDEAIDRSERILTGLNPKLQRHPVSLSLSHIKATNSKKLERNLCSQLEEDTPLAPDVSVARRKATGTTMDVMPAQSDATMAVNEKMCRTIVFATQKAGRGLNRPYVFRSYRATGEHLRNAEYDPAKVSLIDACRASLASPLSFESVKIGALESSFRDASLLEVEPALEAYYEICDSQANARPYARPIQCLLSIGSNDNAFSYGKTRKQPGRDRQRTSDRLLKDEARWQRFDFDRLADPEIHIELSDNANKAFQQIKTRAEDYCRQPDVLKKMSAWAKRLVECRRRRSETVEWNQFAGLKTPCPACGMGQGGFDSLHEHLRRAHDNSMWILR